MTIFKNKSIDKYKGKTIVSKTVRVPKGLAVKLDELQEVCITETGERVTQNTILLGIITNYVNDLERLASEDEDKATAKVLSIIDKSN